MRRMGWLLIAMAIPASGCVAPGAPTPLLARANPYDTSNEMVLSTDQPGAEAYSYLFERVLDIIDDDLEIAFASCYDGRIECKPKIAPGLEQPMKPGSPDFYERSLATFQT